MTERQRAWRRFILINAAALAVLLLFPLLPLLARRVGGVFSFCFFHDVLHLYCLTCGGTRATWLLLHGEVLEALRCHAAVVWTYAALLAVDVGALVRLLRGDTHPFRLPRAFWWGLLAAFVAYALVRDVCLAFGIDWLGDFLP